MSIIGLLTIAGLLAAVVYSLLAVFAIVRFPLTRRVTCRRGGDLPFLSVLKPVRGLDPLAAAADAPRADVLRRALEQSLVTFFDQRYAGGFEVLFGFQDPEDAALPVVEALCAAFPEVPSRIVRVPQARGPNKKASVLAALALEARGDILVASDQDMRVDAGYLEAISAGFDAPDVGVVTCPYRTARADDLGGTFEALAIDVDFIPSTLVACVLDRWLSFALGATMAVRRETLQAIGGFSALEPYLADDYLLGNRSLRAGWRVVMSPYVIDNILPPTSFAGFFGHHLRWHRGYRVCRPLGYLFSVLMNGTVFALGAFAVLGAERGGAHVLGAWVLFRLAVSDFLFRRVAGRPMPLAWRPLVLVKDVVSFVLWGLAVGGNRVRWADRTFVLTPDGRLEDLP